MKAKGIAMTAFAGAAAHIGFSFYTFYEVFGRNAKLPGMVDRSIKEKKNAGANKQTDLRSEWMHEQTFTEYTIKNDRGEALRGYYLKAEKESRNFVLCSHGYRSRGKGEFRFIAKFYHDNGYNVFLVDHTAAGESEGEFISFGHYESADLLLWAEFLNKTFGDDINIILHGVSMGCATVLLLAGKEELPENVRFVISDCGYTSALAQFKSVLDKNHVPSYLLIKTVDMINKVKCGFSFAEVVPVEAVKKIKIPVLFIHGDKDSLVPTYMAKEMYDACNSEKELFIVEGADHAESYRINSAGYEEKILSFTEKYITAKENK